MSPKERLVIIGNGMAGLRVAEELHRLAPDRYAMTIFGAEPHPAYNRILLSPVLAGDKSLDEIILADAGWYAERNITLHAGDEVFTIDRVHRRVVTIAGLTARYDRLVLATGSSPILLPLPGRDLPGVLTFRDIGDVHRIIGAASSGRRAVVIGGGLLGLEAASGLRRRGLAVTVVHLVDRLMERQLDAPAAVMLQRALEAQGLDFVLPAETAAILGRNRVAGVRLADRRELPADLVVMAVGIRPNIALAERAGLACGRGVRVDDGLATSDPRILAVGECVEHRGRSYGLVAPLYEQAAVCARRLAGCAEAAYRGSASATTLKVSGIDLFSAGEFMPADGAEPILFRDPGRGVYKKLVLREGRLVGAVLYGETRDGPWYFDLITGRRDVAALREAIIFGRAHAEAMAATASDADPDPADSAGALPSSAAIDAVLPPLPALSGGVIP